MLRQVRGWARLLMPKRLTRFLENAVRAGDLTKLDESIRLLRVLLGVARDDGPDRGTVLTFLNHALLTRYEWLGSREDLDEAIEDGRQAVGMASEDHPLGLARALVYLGEALLARYERSGSLRDLDEAVQAERAAVARVPEASPVRAACVSGLSNVLRTRFQRSGSLTDVDQAVGAALEAVAIASKDDPNRAGYLSNLGTARRCRFELSGSLADLDRAVEACREAVAVARRDDPLHLAYLSNLSNVLRARYWRSGSLADLEQAIAAARQAVTVIPEGHLNRAVPLVNLAGALFNRYERSGSLADLDQAIAVGREAVGAMPEGGPGRAGCLLDLGISLLGRYERSGSPTDLEQAIEADRQALAATPEDDSVGRARCLSAVGDALLNKYWRSGDLRDIAEAIDADRQAVSAIPDNHPRQAVYLSNLGSALRARYHRSPEPVDLEEAIEASRRAAQIISEDDPARAACLLGLGVALATRYASSGAAGDLDEAIQASRQAAGMQTAPPSLRTWAAVTGARLSAGAARWEDATDGFRTAIGLLGLVAPRNLARRDQEHALESLAGLANDAAACCIRAGLPDLAVELLEQGRGILLGQALDTRTDLTALADEHQALADRFTALRDALDQASHPGSRPPALLEQTAVAGSASVGWLEAERQRVTAEAFEQVITDIRELSGFAGFLRPLHVRDLRAAAADGPVVIVTVSEFGSYALVLTSEKVLEPVPLSEVTPARVADQVSMLLRTVSNPLAWVSPVAGLEDLLAWLWDAIASPVLDRIGLTAPPPPGQPWPRLWWCLPGLLSFLPLHAAGRHSPPDHGQALIDRAVSSYVPTLRALLYSRAARAPDSLAAGDLTVVVTMPHTPGAAELCGAQKEAEAIRKHTLTDILTLTGAQATRDTVLQALPAARRAHFACHGTTSLVSPSDSSLLLADHQELTVTNVARLRLRDTDLAYLSACSTAQPGTRLADEAIHLASAFQLAGYRHVIGTLWPVDDDTAILVADDIYAAIAGTRTSANAALALHTAIRAQRGQHADKPIAWASHIHIGT
jgi:tetratricopeptide (TPR) repeat protein